MGNRRITKARKPLNAAVLSFLSLGLGQIYNGELRKGIALKGCLWISVVFFAVTNFKSTRDLLFFSLFLLAFCSLKLYSMVQAGLKSRSQRSGYVLRGFNRFSFYAFLAILSFAVNLISFIGVRQVLFSDMTESHPFRNVRARERYLEHYDKRAGDWPVPSETRTVDGSFGRTFIRISGPKDAPPMVLIPGAGSTSLMWLPNVEALSGEFRTYALDNIYDFGRSAYTRKIRTPRGFTDWLDELFTGLGLDEEITVVGMSYGGWLTSQYALHHPERVKAAVMLAPASTVVPLSMDWVKRAVLSMIPHPHFLRSFLYHLMEDLATSGGEGRIRFEEWADTSELAFRCFKPKSLVNPTVLTEEEWRSLRMPVLYVVGDHERIYDPVKALERLHTAAPQVKTVLIHGAGHDLTVFKADQVNRAVLEFLGNSVSRR